jgi:iron complex transport system substrate-binding protein
MIRKAAHAMISFLLAIKALCLLALDELVWIVRAICLNLLIVWQPRKIWNSYKFSSIFLITIVFAIASCNNSPTEIAARQTSAIALRSPAEMKVVSHALGKVEIPVNPQRVVVLDDQVLLDPVLALGIEPVGALSCSGCGEDFRGIPSNLVTHVLDVGTASEPSLEKILSFKPDLIVAREW